MGSIFFQAFVYLLAAVITVPIAKKLGLGSVLGYLIAGVLIGPFGLELIGGENQDIMHFAEFGVVMMLFLIGLELKPSLLWKLRAPILGLGGFQVLLCTLCLAGSAYLMNLNMSESLAVGMILALSSTAIVLQTLAEKGEMKSPGGQSSFSILLFQDIAVIPMFALLPLLATYSPVLTADSHGGGHHGFDIGTLPTWAQALCVFGAVLVIIIGGRYLIRPIFRFIASVQLREIFTVVALLLIIGIALGMELVGLSPALGAFLAGVVLAESEYRQELEADIEPFKGLLLGLFFISVGAGIDFLLLQNEIAKVVQWVFVLIGVKLSIIFMLGRVFKLGLKDNFLVAFSLSQGGEFAFVLFSFCGQHGVIGPETSGLLTLVVALSMAITPLLFILNDLLGKQLLKSSDDREADTIQEDDSGIIIAGFGRFGNIVGRMLRAHGFQMTILEHSAARVEALRKLGIKAYYGDACRLDLLESAGASKAKVLVVAIDDPEKAIELVEMTKQYFPHLKVYVRSFGRSMAVKLHKLGVKHIYRETLDTSLSMSVDALKGLGVRAFQAQRAADQFKVHDELSVKEVSEMEMGSKDMYRKSKEMIEWMENSIKRDQELFHITEDAAWDSATRRKELNKKMKTE